MATHLSQHYLVSSGINNLCDIDLNTDKDHITFCEIILVLYTKDYNDKYIVLKIVLIMKN